MTHYIIKRKGDDNLAITHLNQQVIISSNHVVNSIKRNAPIKKLKHPKHPISERR